MNKHIDAEALVTFLRNARKNLPTDITDFHTRDEMLLNFQQYLEMMPVVNVKQGEWALIACDVHKCSVCGLVVSSKYQALQYKYCPACGAMMKVRAPQ